MKFVTGDVVPLPSPPPGEEFVLDDGNGDPLPGIRPIPPIQDPFSYRVVFRVNGQVLARTHFVYPEPAGILAKAWIDLKQNARGVAADVHVAFPGFPYHHIVDWGQVRRRGNTFYLPATAERIDFIVDPGVVEQNHRYRLIGGGGNGEPIPFEKLDVETGLRWNRQISLSRRRMSGMTHGEDWCLLMDCLRNRRSTWRLIRFSLCFTAKTERMLRRQYR